MQAKNHNFKIYIKQFKLSEKLNYNAKKIFNTKTEK